MRIVLLLALALAACGHRAAPPSSGCDHCNGGTIVGIDRDDAAEVHETYASHDRCDGTACTEMACADAPQPICRQGICGVQIGDQVDVPPLPPP